MVAGITITVIPLREVVTESCRSISMYLDVSAQPLDHDDIS